MADADAGWTVRRIAAVVDGTVEGDATHRLTGVSSLSAAEPHHIAFLANRKYVPAFRGSAAGCVLVGPREAVPAGRTVIRVADAYAAFAQVVRCFHPEEAPAPRVDPRAWVADDAVVEGATIEAFAWVGPGAVIGPGTWVQTGAVVGAGARVGRDARLMAHSVVCAGCVLGDRVWAMRRCKESILSKF